MTLTAVASVRGAPGVTTTALLVAGCLVDGAVVEADVDGGVLALRYDLPHDASLTSLAAARTAAPDGWRRHAQLAGGVPVLVGPDSPARAQAFWQLARSDLVSALLAADADLVADTGRFRADDPTGLLSASSELLLVARANPEHLVTLAYRLEEARQLTSNVAVVLIGGGAYSAQDVAEQLGADVVGRLPDDGRTATVLNEGGGLPGSLSRSQLARAGRALADALVERLAVVESTPPVDLRAVPEEVIR